MEPMVTEAQTMETVGVAAGPAEEEEEASIEVVDAVDVDEVDVVDVVDVAGGSTSNTTPTTLQMKTLPTNQPLAESDLSTSTKKKNAIHKTTTTT